jgi:hypothetical protein
VSVFWDKDGILLVDYVEKGATIMAKYCVALINKLKQQLVSKLLSAIMFLQDNAAPHKAAITHHKLADLHIGVLKHFEGREFSSTEETTLAADRWFVA